MSVATHALSLAGSAGAFARRAIVLTILFVVAAILLANVSAPQVDALPRFPEAAATYAVDGWTVSQPQVEGRVDAAGNATVLFVTWTFHSAAGDVAELNVTTSPQAKLVYRAGADVPLQGSGYTVETAPGSLVTPRPDRAAQIARREGDTWLQIATYGEQRGVFGNGPLGWVLAVFDMVLGRANDYYLARVLVPGDSPTAAANAVHLADALLPQLAAAYRAL